MGNDRHFSFKKAQIENFLKTEFKKKFKSNAKISLRKRHKFIDEVTCKIAKRFGKNVLVLIDFSKNGFCSVVSPVETESTEKGKLIKSFSHPQVFYTSHCVDRFSERTQPRKIALSSWMRFSVKPCLLMAKMMGSWHVQMGFLPMI